MTDREKWKALFGAWQPKHDALMRFPLFDERGTMRTDVLDDYDRLRAEVDAAQAEMDRFIEAAFGRR